MTQPDIQKHLQLLIGAMALELAAAKALIESLQAQIPKDDAGRAES